jgi:acetyltransferase-like isoleucine patch superfamily enzyme
MGDRVGIVMGTKFDNPALMRIGNNVVIAPATIFNHDGSVEVVRHAEGDGAQLDPGAVCIDIRDNVFIGEGALVRYGVRIGPNAVVGIGAVVTRDVPPNSVVAGNPARVIGTWSDYLAKLRERTQGHPWTELLATRTVAHDPAMEPELTRLRQSTFARWDDEREH